MKEFIANVDEITVEDYMSVYDAIIALSIDADGFGLFDEITEEDVEKCKWFAAIMDTMDDVPARRVKHIFSQKKIEYDSSEMIERLLDAKIDSKLTNDKEV